MPVINGMNGVHEMEFWMNLMFGNSVGLMSMLVIIGTFLLISSYAAYFIYKVMNAKPPKEGQ
ncbi:DUF3149 domain-containing protein [Aeromonas hydrophila]|uniref:DUF3149 domain-containing protein n=1 Tax=Aeromonas hydrophila TaxID=644 RepID=UPI0019375091|nr:DUF3149 domain-containing protein [Aeromonas hydrophila]MBW3814536.1 DUF3149 domain-containing protein [Aeromonas hydrophila]BCO15051.1 hypothetical protein RIMD111065_34070 [Aeromonas hydrophila]